MSLVINDDVDLSLLRALKVTANTLQVSRQPTDIFCETVTETVPTSSASLSFTNFQALVSKFSIPTPSSSSTNNFLSPNFVDKKSHSGLKR
jgi:hypothetical protein